MSRSKILSGLKLFAAAGAFSACLDASSTAGTSELPVSADACAIHYALTLKHRAGCRAVDANGLGSPRSLSQTGERAALPLGSQPEEAGYFVRFAFNSDALTPEYRAHLDRLAQVVASPELADMCIRLVGHADSVGPQSYNQVLSDARARRVAAHLAHSSRLPMERISVQGVGETQLLQDYPGTHPVQRRVEILARDFDGSACR